MPKSEPQLKINLHRTMTGSTIKKQKQKKNSASNELHQSEHPFTTLQQPDDFNPLNALQINENRMTNSINVMQNEADVTIKELTIRNTFKNGENLVADFLDI